MNWRPILAIDCGTNLGWAHNAAVSPTGRPLSGHVTLTGNTLGHFVAQLNGFLLDRIALLKPDLVAYEAPIHTTKHSFNIDEAKKKFGAAAIIEGVCFLKGIPVVSAVPSTVKKAFTGNGHADKDAMRATCRMHGWIIDSHDEADAIGVLHWAMGRYRTAIRRYQAESEAA